MASLRAFPYLRPAESRIHSTEWLVRKDGQFLPLPLELEHWDPTVDLEVAVTAEVAADDIRTDCQAGGGAEFALGLSWHCPLTSLRGKGSLVPLPPSSGRIELGVSVPGEMLADRVKLELQLLFRRSGRNPSPLAATRPGSLLWKHDRVVVLEGSGSRFPVELVDFESVVWPPAEAGWYLHWDSEDLHQPAFRKMRLLVNTQHVAVRQAVTAPTADGPDRAVAEAIRYDVARTLIRGALSNEEFVCERVTYDEGSLGAFLRRLITNLFPHYSFPVLQRKLREGPADLECEMQAVLGVFDWK